MATYPNDVIFDVNNFSVIGNATFNNTGNQVEFTLPSSVDHRGQVLAFNQGVLQDTTTYSVSGSTITFVTAPDSSNLTLKTISVPANLVKVVTVPTSVSAVQFSNSEIVTINSNSYLVDGATSTWALPGGSTAGAKNQLLVSLSGILQENDWYTFPSATLDSAGIDTPVINSSDTLDIRLFDSSISAVNDRCKNMSDRKPDRGFQVNRGFNTVKSESQAGYEKRRIMSRKTKRNFDFTYTNISGTEKEALETFYDSRLGEWEAFQLNLTHINEQGGFATVRFDGELEIVHNRSRGTGLNDNFYIARVKMKEVDD